MTTAHVTTSHTAKKKNHPFTGERLLFLGILLLAFALRVYRLDHHSFWWDETWTAVITTLPPAEMLAEVIDDRAHPPLYIYAINAWASIGISEFVLRFFSVAWGMISIALTHCIGTVAGGRKVGLLAALLLAFSPFHIWYSQEARMYTLLVATIAAATLFLLRILRHETRANWLGYSLSMLVALYTHYFAPLILVAHYVFFSLHYRYVKPLLRRWILYTAAAALFFGVWGSFIALTGGVRNASIGWIAPVDWDTPFFTLLAFSAGPTIDATQPLYYLSLLVFLTGLVAAFWRFGRRPAEGQQYGTFLAARLLFAWLLVPFLLAFVISLDLPIPQKRSIYMDRYLIVVLPAFMVLAAWGIVSVAKGRRWVWGIAVAAVFLPNLVALNNMYFDPDYGRTDWRRTLSHIEEAWQPGDVLLIAPGDVLPLVYYMGNRLPFADLAQLFADVETSPSADAVAAAIAPVAQEWDRAWLITVTANVDPHGFPQTRNREVRRKAEEGIYKTWLNKVYRPLQTDSFTGITVTLYDFSALAETTNGTNE